MTGVGGVTGGTIIGGGVRIIDPLPVRFGIVAKVESGVKCVAVVVVGEVVGLVSLHLPWVKLFTPACLR